MLLHCHDIAAGEVPAFLQPPTMPAGALRKGEVLAAGWRPKAEELIDTAEWKSRSLRGSTGPVCTPMSAACATETAAADQAAERGSPSGDAALSVS